MNGSDGQIFIAGAIGVLGRRLCRLLLGDGWHVAGSTRSPGKAAGLRAVGVVPVVMDVFDEQQVREAVAEVWPDIVIHQLTGLPDGLEPARMPEARVRNARIRHIGTRYLLAAAAAVNATRVIAQSIAFVYAPGPRPYHEDAPLDTDPNDTEGLIPAGIPSLERQVLSAPMAGIVLRYGKFYGPGTGFDDAPSEGPLHVDAAAHAARLAVTRGAPGIYNIAEEDGTVSCRKAIAELGWRPEFRMAPWVG